MSLWVLVLLSTTVTISEAGRSLVTTNDQAAAEVLSVKDSESGRSRRHAFNPLFNPGLGAGMGMIPGSPFGLGQIGPPNLMGANFIPPTPTPTSNPMAMIQMMCQFLCEEIVEGGMMMPGMRSGGLFMEPKMTCVNPQPNVIYAPANQTSALVYWWPPIGAGSEGMLMARQLTGFGGPGSLFPAGNHTIRYMVTDDSTGFSSSCDINFRVEVKRCYRPPWPVGGWRECENSDVIFGSQCKFGCGEGYILKGPSTIVCQESGYFDHFPPTCQLKDCPVLRLPANAVAYRCTNGNFVNSLCFLDCDVTRGYRSSVPALRTCMPNGQWSLPSPSCKDSSPPRFTNCPTSRLQVIADKGQDSVVVTWPDILANDTQGLAMVKQISGLPSGSRFKMGTHEIKYGATDADGNSAPPCAFMVDVEVISCPPPKLLDKYLEYKCPDGHNYGSKCALSCSMGLPLDGALYLTCDLDNTQQLTWQWMGSVPRCIESPCTKLSPPANGVLICDKWAGGTVCQMQCNDKFDIPRTVASAQHYVCTFSTGHWSPTSEVPDCTEMRRPSLMVLPSELYYYAEDCGTEATLSNIRKQFIDSLLKSVSWRDACEKDKNCNIDNVRVECGAIGRRKRQVRGYVKNAAPSAAAIVTWDFVVEFRINNMTVRDAIESHDKMLKNMARSFQGDVEKGNFELNVTGFANGNKSFAYGWTDFVCDRGLLPTYITASCAACPAGTFFQTNDCVLCPLGTFQTKDASTSCEACSPGYTTLQTGSRNSSSCIELCPAGSFSPTGTLPCSPCVPGTYQPAKGELSCVPCPRGTRTDHPGSRDVDGCHTYDVLVMGPETVAFNRILSENLTDFTVAFWFKANDAGRRTTSFTFKDVSNTSSLVLDFNPQNSLLKLPGGNKTALLFFSEDTWTHVTLTWNSTGREATVYIGGTPVLRQSFPEALPVIVEAGSYLELDVGFKSATTLQGFHLVPELLTEAEVVTASSSCRPPVGDALVSIDDLPINVGSEILIFTPSTCDAHDVCYPNPCQGHVCTVTPEGYNCTCVGGYSGENCTIPPDYCVENLCKNNATCVSGIENYTCICPGDYIGPFCDSQLEHGNWGRWSDWSTCSTTCNLGVIKRTRACDSPPPGPGGNPCYGNATEVQICRNDPCKPCLADQLERSYGLMHHCSGDGMTLTCNLTCRAGLTFLEAPPVYRCENGIWFPSTKVVPCTRAASPKRLELRFNGVYDSMGCISDEQATQLQQSFLEKTKNTPCVREKKCTPKVTVQSCGRQTRTRRSANSMGVIISVSLAIEDLDTGNGGTEPGSSSFSQFVQAVDALERTAKEINDTQQEFFAITTGNFSQRLEPNKFSIQPVISCAVGSFPKNAMCVDCPVGTYMANKICQLCDFGTYQNQSGSDVCFSCPEGKTTRYKGSVTDNDCTVIKTSTTAKTTKPVITSESSGQDDPLLRPNYVEAAKGGELDPIMAYLPAIIGSACGFVLIVALVVVLLICRMKRRRRDSKPKQEAEPAAGTEKEVEVSAVPSWVKNMPSPRT